MWSTSSPPWLSPSPRSSLCQMKPVSPLWQIWKGAADSNPTITWLSLCPGWGWWLYSCSEICTIECVPVFLELALHVCVSAPPLSLYSERHPAALMRDYSETKMGTFCVFPYGNSIGIFNVATSITIRNKREDCINFFTVTDREALRKIFFNVTRGLVSAAALCWFQ